MTKTILIVEDDPFIAMDLQDTFEDAGYKVLGPVAAVLPGLEIVRAKKPDVAMLDYNLGRETSVVLAHELEAQDVPYLFLSGQVDRVVTAECEAPRKVFSKPFEPNSLIAYVESLVMDHHVG